MNSQIENLINQAWELGNKISSTVQTTVRDELSRIENEIKKMAEENKRKEAEKEEINPSAAAAEGFAIGRIEQLELICKNQAREINTLKNIEVQNLAIKNLIKQKIQAINVLCSEIQELVGK